MERQFQRNEVIYTGKIIQIKFRLSFRPWNLKCSKMLIRGATPPSVLPFLVLAACLAVSLSSMLARHWATRWRVITVVSFGHHCRLESLLGVDWVRASSGRVCRFIAVKDENRGTASQPFRQECSYMLNNLGSDGHTHVLLYFGRLWQWKSNLMKTRLTLAYTVCTYAWSSCVDPSSFASQNKLRLPHELGLSCWTRSCINEMHFMSPTN